MREVATALREAGERLGVDREAVLLLGRLVELVAEDPLSPTAAADPKQVAGHVLDSLQGLTVAALRAARRLVDVGSGAGFPGLVLAAAKRECAVTLLESNGEKAAFLLRLVGALGLENVAVVGERVELWREGLETAEVVTARAVGPQPVVVEYAAPLLEVGGHLVEWRTVRPQSERERGLKAASLLGLALVAELPYAPGDRRRLEVFRKERPTPERFPRRPGVARKRPLA